MKNTLPAAVLSLLIATSVFLNGIHVKDVLNSALTDASQMTAKVAADLHPHVDKQIHKMTSDIPQLDGRSLRLRDYKRLQLNSWKNLLDSWRDQLALLIG